MKDPAPALIAPPPAPAPAEGRARSGLELLVLGVLALITWMLAHPYEGLFHDAGLYALQALARSNADSLGQDVFLRFGSQDKFTIFSPLYAAASRLMGLEPAAAVLTLGSQLALFACAWALARSVMSPSIALLGVAFLVAIPGFYGPDRIFTCVESFLTPRMAAEAFTLGSVAAALTGRRVAALILVIAAALLHPLMAAAGFAALVFLALPRLDVFGRRAPAPLPVPVPVPANFAHSRSARATVVLTAIIVLAILTALIVAAVAMPTGQWGRFDPLWLQLVTDRSPYLFIAHWQLDDWARAAVTIATLTAGLFLLRRDGTGTSYDDPARVLSRAGSSALDDGPARVLSRAGSSALDDGPARVHSHDASSAQGSDRVRSVYGDRANSSHDYRAPMLCKVALLTTLSGIALTWIACDRLQLVLLTQLQPWRWQWFGTVTAALLLPVILRAGWQHSDLGARTALHTTLLLPVILHGGRQPIDPSARTVRRTTTLLLLAAWIFGANAYALASALAALASLASDYVGRVHPKRDQLRSVQLRWFQPRWFQLRLFQPGQGHQGPVRPLKYNEARLLFWGACGLLAIAVIWRLATNSQFTEAHYLDRSIPLWMRDAMSFARDGSATGAVMAFAWWLMRSVRTKFAPLLLVAAAGAGCVALWPQALASWTAREFASQDAARYAPLRARIPAGADVFWPESPVAAWLLVDRPSYLSVLQTSGMVFSRPAAIELQRRSAALSSVIPPQTFLAWNSGTALSLSLQQLQGACRSGAFEYLMTRADLGFAPLAAVAPDAASRAGFVPPLVGAAPDPVPRAKTLRLYHCPAAPPDL